MPILDILCCSLLPACCSCSFSDKHPLCTQQDHGLCLPCSTRRHLVLQQDQAWRLQHQLWTS
jgi:hypothetical protein